MRLTFALALAPLFAAAPALADVALPGMTHVPLELTLEGQASFADAEFAVLNCNSADGRHAFALAKPDAPLACKTKLPPAVFAVPKKEAAELRALFAKDVGWGSEYGEARKALEAKAAKCGEVGESTYLEDKLGVAKLVGRYALDKDAAGKCSLRKVSWTQVKGANAASTPGAPEPPPAPNPSANKTPASLRSGGCALAPPPSAAAPPWALFALGLVAARRRKTAWRASLTRPGSSRLRGL